MASSPLLQHVYFQLRPDCVLVRGYTRSLLCDTLRGIAYPISLAMGQLLLHGKGKTVPQLLASGLVSSPEQLDAALTFLQERNCLLWTNTPEPLLAPVPPAVSSDIHFASLDISARGTELLPAIRQALDNLCCPSLLLRSRLPLSREYWLQVLQEISYPGLEHLSIEVCSGGTAPLQAALAVLPDVYAHLAKIIVTDAPENKRRDLPGGKEMCWQTGTDASDTEVPFLQDQLHFDTKAFQRSSRGHSYFSNKLHFSADGTLRNTPECPESFGPVSALSKGQALLDLVSAPDFGKYALADKRRCDVCHLCELRRICTDRRIPRQRERRAEWFFTSECDYNPFLGSYRGMQRYRTLAACGVISNSEGYYIDHQRIRAISKG